VVDGFGGCSMNASRQREVLYSSLFLDFRALNVSGELVNHRHSPFIAQADVEYL
jgi:hypothetical protein